MKEIVKLGQVLSSREERDAVHVAVLPCRTHVTSQPGQHVGVMLIDSEYYADPASNEPVGIVDPFLNHAVGPQHRFYVMLYPNTITSLRHEWTHQSISSATDAKPKHLLVSESERWLRDFAEEIGIGYSELLEAAQAWIDFDATYRMPSDLPSAIFTKRKEMWFHLEMAAGIKAKNDEDTFFWCSC